MIALKSSSTAKAAFAASLQVAGVKHRHLGILNVMRGAKQLGDL